MSNSIWKTDNLQKADTRKQILFYAGGSSFPYLGWHYPNKGFGTWVYDDVQKWCYIDDLISQADKAERLQKAVNTALISIGTAAIFDGEDAKKYADAKIDLIKQLIKGE